MSPKLPNDDLNVLLKDLSGELKKCVRCGECRGVCPVYDKLTQEKYTNRGKIALLESFCLNEQPFSKDLANVLDNCLLCLACEANCGSNVATSKIIPLARALAVKSQKMPLVKKVINQGLRAGDAAMELGSKFQNLAFKEIPGSSGLRRRFPIPFLDKDQYIPKLVYPSFRQVAHTRSIVKKAKDEVVFFTGCLSNYVFVDLARNLVAVLNNLDVSVNLPYDQGCCGAPMHTNGELDALYEVARANIKALSKTDPKQKIIVCCASGGYMLKKVYPHMFQADKDLSEKALAISQRVCDISQYLVDDLGLKSIAEKVVRKPKATVTYHDPCHLVRGQGISEQPRSILRMIFSDQYQKMRDANRCCGSGGTYGLTHRQTSQAILEDKIEALKACRAEIIATGCPACMIQLKDGIKNHDLNVRVYHTIQLLAWGMGLSNNCDVNWTG